MKDKYGFTPDGARDAFGHQKGWKDGKYVIKFGENDYEEVKTAAQQWNDIWGYHPKEEQPVSTGTNTGTYDDLIENLSGTIEQSIIESGKSALRIFVKIIFMVFKGFKKLIIMLLSSRKKK